MNKLVIRNLTMGAIVILVLVFSYGKITQTQKHARWDTSPCGTKTFSNGYVLGDFGSSDEIDHRDYKDDGVHVWRIKSIYFKNFNPHIKMAQTPEVEWEMVMERTPQSCLTWIEKTGIYFRKK